MSRLYCKPTHILVLALLPKSSMSACTIFCIVLLGHHNTRHKPNSVAYYAEIAGLNTPLSQLVDAHFERTPNATLSISREPNLTLPARSDKIGHYYSRLILGQPSSSDHLQQSPCGSLKWLESGQKDSRFLFLKRCYIFLQQVSVVKGTLVPWAKLFERKTCLKPDLLDKLFLHKNL